MASEIIDVATGAVSNVVGGALAESSPSSVYSVDMKELIAAGGTEITLPDRSYDHYEDSGADDLL